MAKYKSYDYSQSVLLPVPVGIIFVPRPGSLTLTANIMAFPTVVVAGLGVTVVVVVRKFTVNDAEPKLPKCALSPP